MPAEIVNPLSGRNNGECRKSFLQRKKDRLKWIKFTAVLISGYSDKTRLQLEKT
jgi:hypothetical protein